jgi:hypothetical protein
MPIILGLLCSIVISSAAKMKKPERVTVAVECVYQKTGIAMTSCLALFSGDDQQRALGVPFWYTGMQTCFVGVYCLVSWKLGWTKAPPNENIVKVIFQSYELNEDEEDNGGVGSGSGGGLNAVNREDDELRNGRGGGGGGGSAYDFELNHVEPTSSSSLSTNGGKNDVDTEDDKQSSDSFHVNSKVPSK